MNTTNPATRFPVYFVSHGGGPWPYVDGMRNMYAKTEREFKAMPCRLPGKPKAVLVISGHWEARDFTVSTAQNPPMEYDYYGFPEHTYHIKYPAAGSPALAAHVSSLLAEAGFTAREDESRGFDHGTFVPLSLMYPNADVPVVMLSLKSNYDPAEHIRVGQALGSLRDEGVLIIGSGLTYHNMRGFRNPSSRPIAEAFEAYLNTAISQADARQRNDMLIAWESAPNARLVHPKEDHLLPLMVAAGAAARDTGRTVFIDHVMDVPMATYEFGGTRPN